ncbi:MAG: acetyl-CoA carboxylase biotin carboxyl carrier protein [Pseudomonadota bacterium]|nr:acetyl-CoA carboxylase biotin carboxyl carrier protein [Pseudomonadota bacterium]
MEIKKIKAIVELVKESGIAELEITEGEEKLRISAVINSPQPQIQYPQHIYQHQQAAPAPVASSADTAPSPQISEKALEIKQYITSPMVGTFYRASSPSTPPFVEIGQQIKVGQVLCIIEAMKLMNQIESDKDGIIKEILMKDGEPVEFGQQLFVIE